MALQLTPRGKYKSIENKVNFDKRAKTGGEPVDYQDWPCLTVEAGRDSRHYGTFGTGGPAWAVAPRRSSHAQHIDIHRRLLCFALPVSHVIYM